MQGALSRYPLQNWSYQNGRIVAVDVEVMRGAGSWAPFLIDKTTKGAELCYYETLGTVIMPQALANRRQSSRLGCAN